MSIARQFCRRRAVSSWRASTRPPGDWSGPYRQRRLSRGPLFARRNQDLACPDDRLLLQYGPQELARLVVREDLPSARALGTDQQLRPMGRLGARGEHLIQDPVRRRGGVGRPAGRRHVRGRLGVEHAGHLQQSRGQASIAHVGASQLRLDPLPRRTRFRRCADPDRAIGSTAQHRLPRRIQRQDVTVRGRGPGAVAPAAARGPHMPPGGRAITGARTTPALHGCSSTRRSIHPARCAPGTAVGRRTGGRSSGTGVRPSCRATGPTGGAR